MLSKVSIVIPVFNEVGTVEELLRRVSEQATPGLEKEIIIVESHSTDGTRERVQNFISHYQGLPTQPSSQIKLILQDVPRGKGNAVREGLKATSGDIILIQDGDLEYDVKDYPSLLEPIMQGRTELVLGSRHLGAGHWKIRKFEENPIKSALLNLGGIFFHTFFNILYNQRLSDPTTMYKVFRKDCLDGIHLEANRFDFDYELLGKLLLKGYIPFEVPVSYVSRGFKEGKKIRVLRDPWTWIVAIVKYRFAPIDQPIRGSIYSSAIGYLLLSLFLFFSSGLLLNYFGGPLVSPDSIFYLESSKNPWSAIGYWHPAGLSFVLFFGFQLGLSLVTIFQLLLTTLGLGTFWVLKRGGGSIAGWLGLLLLFLDPAWLMLRVTLWTEIPFITALVCVAALFSIKRTSRKALLTSTITLFLVTLQFRHTALFFVPAWILALGYAWENQKWKFTWRRVANASIALVLTWALYNLITTKGLTSATRSRGEECKAMVLSFNEFPYCQWNPKLPICAVDPERKYLNQKSFFLKPEKIGYRDPDYALRKSGEASTCDQLFFLQYHPESPINQFKQSDSYNICHLRKDILETVFLHHPFGLIRVLIQRTWNQFGAWDWTERSGPLSEFKNMDHLDFLDYLLRKGNEFQWVYQCLLIFTFVGIAVLRTLSPALVFLGIGSLGHAFGISLVNPYLSLRYMAISKFLLAMTFVILLFRINYRDMVRKIP